MVDDRTGLLVKLVHFLVTHHATWHTAHCERQLTGKIQHGMTVCTVCAKYKLRHNDDVITIKLTELVLIIKFPTKKVYFLFLLLARYVPNVAERSVWEQCIISRTDRPTTDRPADRPTLHFVKLQTAISRERVIRSTSRLILEWGSRGQRIEWTYFRLDQIQDGGWPPSWKISNGHISGTGRRMDFMFGSTVKVQEKIMREE